jgi:hypothetical protein
MSGLEVAGVVLGAFPLIISGLEHWRDMAKVSGFFWRIRKEYTKCRSDVKYQKIMFQRNMKELLLPMVAEAEINELLNDPGGAKWTNNQTLQDQLEGRLQESYGVYTGVIEHMKETIDALRKELCFDDASVQSRLAPMHPVKQSHPLPNPNSPSVLSKGGFDYRKFRIKFSLGESVREQLFAQLEESNRRLERLLSSSDKLALLQSTRSSNPRSISMMEKVFKKVWRSSELFFKALQNAWQCPCQKYHVANIRLEHRTAINISFEIVLMFVTGSESYVAKSWSWQELQCGEMHGCLHSHSTLPSPAQPSNTTSRGGAGVPKSTRKGKQVAFATATANSPPVELADLLTALPLCQKLAGQSQPDCIGIIGHDESFYYLHILQKREEPSGTLQLTLAHILSDDFEGFIDRRQRYKIAMLLASFVAQMSFTPWLRTRLAKEDILFFNSTDASDIDPYDEPFIRQAFFTNSASNPSTGPQDCNFQSLGIILIELCFGKRLEDQPMRKKYPPGDAQSKEGYDLLAATKWSNYVCGEGGDEYANAVKWCFTAVGDMSKSWRGEIIKNVLQPLERCQEHLRIANVT